MRTRIKICGITREQDLRFAATIGADAVGLVFQPQRPRVLDLERARVLVRSKPPFVSAVALFADPEEKEVRRVLAALSVDYLQFHGMEPADFCASFDTPYIKAVPMGTLQDPDVYVEDYVATAAGLVFDSHQVGQCGGTGTVFDWSKLERRFDVPMIIAGGLTPENVGESIVRLKPYGVDVSSGVESAKGVKDNRLMQKFVTAVNRADSGKSGIEN